MKRVYVDAAEFGPELWKTTVSACHDAGKEGMLTMPHIFRTEAERYFERSQKAFCEAGFDGVLIRSMEEIGYLKEHGPEIPWVFDYGMYGMNDRAESFLMKMGHRQHTLFSRVVTGRDRRFPKLRPCLLYTSTTA